MGQLRPPINSGNEMPNFYDPKSLWEPVAMRLVFYAGWHCNAPDGAATDLRLRGNLITLEEEGHLLYPEKRFLTPWALVMNSSPLTLYSTMTHGPRTPLEGTEEFNFLPGGLVFTTRMK